MPNVRASERPHQHAAAPSPQRPHTRQPRAERPSLSRRTYMLSVAGLAWTPGALLDSLKGEASLWQQEAQLYSRKAASALNEATGGLQQADSAAATAAAVVPLDAGLAEALLAAPLTALRRLDAANGSSGRGSAQGSGSGQDANGSTSSSGSFSTASVHLPQLDEERYRRDYDALLAQELPYFKSAGSCGHCGSASGPAALSDPAWFDFLSYIQYKALGRQLSAALAPSGAAAASLSGWERMHAGSPEMQLKAAEQAWAATGQLPGSGAVGFGAGGTPEMQRQAAAAAFRARGQPPTSGSGSGNTRQPPPLSPADVLRLSLGAVILQHIEADLAAAARGSPSSTTSSSGSGGATGSGSSGNAAALAAICSTSPVLDDVREGARALLDYFTGKGLVAVASCAQFGLSQDEYENHYTWTLGEPAFLKYWLQSPATLRSAAALDAEEGFSQDYVAATLQAYFRRCGVAASSLKRYPSYGEPELVAEQWTLRRVAPLPANYDWEQYREWQPDFCPLADEACY